MALDRELLQFILRGTQMCVANFMAIHLIVLGISHKPTNVNLMLVLEEMSGDHQSKWDSASGHHGYQHQISWQSIQ